MRAVEVRQDIPSSVLRRQVRLEKDGRVVGRLLAIANVLDGMERDEAARRSGMTRHILRGWIVRFNADGVAGLRDRARGHKRRALSVDQEQALEDLVAAGPEDGRIRWRLVDLQAEIEARFGVAYHERSVGKIMRRLGFAQLSVRPVHPKTDAGTQEAYKKTSRHA